jgi:alpha-ketoglutarate-dependent taurine dioxygenase
MSYEFVSRRILPSFRNFRIEPLTGALGGTVSGVNLAEQLTTDTVAELRLALLEFKVLFFRNQELDEERHLALARHFGMPQGPGAIPRSPWNASAATSPARRWPRAGCPSRPRAGCATP